VFHADGQANGQTDRETDRLEANSCYSQFLRKDLKMGNKFLPNSTTNLGISTNPIFPAAKMKRQFREGTEGSLR